jgi:hypothetical protein
MELYSCCRYSARRPVGRAGTAPEHGFGSSQGRHCTAHSGLCFPTPDSSRGIIPHDTHWQTGLQSHSRHVIFRSPTQIAGRCVCFGEAGSYCLERSFQSCRRDQDRSRRQLDRSRRQFNCASISIASPIVPLQSSHSTATPAGGADHPSTCEDFGSIRLVNNPGSRMAGLMAGGLAASSQPARLYTKQGSSQPAEHQKPDGLIGLIV